MAFWTQIIIQTSGGGSITLYSPTSGLVNDTNKDFGFSSKPSIVVVNGSSYKENSGWSWNGGTLTATLDFPPGTSGDVYGIK